MIDKILATIAILMFLIFVAFLAFYINKVALWVVILSVCVMAVVDFWQGLRAGENANVSAARKDDLSRSDLGGAG